MPTANQTNHTGQNQGSANNASSDPNFKLKNTFLEDLGKETFGMTSEGAKMIIGTCRYAQKFITDLYFNHIHKHIAIVGGVAATGTVVTGSLVTLGPSGTAAAVGGAAYAALGIGAFVAGVGAVPRVWGWIKDATTVVTGAVKEKIADVRSFLGAVGHGVQVMQQDRLHAREKKLESKVEAQETKLENEVDAVLARIATRVNLTNSPLINKLRQEAQSLLKDLREDRLPEVLRQAKTDGIDPRVAHREIGKFQRELRLELTKNIIRACREAPTVADREAIIDERVAQLKERIAKFKVEKNVKAQESQTQAVQEEPISPGTEQAAGVDAEAARAIIQEMSAPIDAGAHTDPSQQSKGEERVEQEEENAGHAEASQEQSNAAETSPAPEGVFAKYFGSREVPENVEAALSALTSTSAEKDKKRAVQLVQKELKHAEVTLEPGDTSPVAEVVRRASIPAGREIPHYDDLCRQLQDKFPKARMEFRNENGSEYIAITKGNNTIFLENRHHELGGKVTVYYQQKVDGKWQDVVQGGMWNDKVEDVVAKFLETGTYPRLKQEGRVSHRIVDTVLSSTKAATALFGELKRGDLKVEIKSIPNKGWKIEVSEGKHIYAQREVAGDSRKWKILDDDGTVLEQNISITNLKKQILSRR